MRPTHDPCLVGTANLDRASPLPSRLASTILLLVWGIALLAAILLPTWTHPDDPGDGRVRQTIRVSLLGYFLAEGLILANKDRWLARLAWTLGWAAYLVHVGLAFHYAFGWSHGAAVEQTRARSGVGEGIYVSHLFTLLWTGDVAWWWLSPRTHFTRQGWVAWALHGFMAFIVFNGTVVYETGLVRWAALTAFAALALLAWRRS